MSSSGIDKVYYIGSESEREMFTELYSKFIEQYSIMLDRDNELVVTESFDTKGIDIRPENGKVKCIYALKPASELEIKLIKNDLISNYSQFETKDKKTIVVSYK